MRKVLPLLLALTLAALGCSSGSGNNVVPDGTGDDAQEQDFGPLPDVPTHIFELVEQVEQDDQYGDWILPDIDGFVFEVIDSDGKTDAVGPQPDGACYPDCTRTDGTKKACGPDGCGSICGYCSYENECVVDECKPICVPHCEDKECGTDGCYGECPPGCDEGFACDDTFKCVPNCDHDGHCAGKQCGPDGCGNVCGICGLGTLCNQETGMCEADPCDGIPLDTGKCTDGVLFQCVSGLPKETVCSTLGPDFYCKFDAVAQKYGCSEGCVPQCTWEDGSAKECGYDGCYGNCGTCPTGWTCNAGRCYPQPGAECGWLTEAGECFDNFLWYCAGGQLLLEDCTALGATCQFEPSVMKFRCK